MRQYSNGIPASDIADVVWFKSSVSNATGNCVELAVLPGGEVAMRNSRHPAGPALVFTREEVAAFVAGAKKSEFDQLA